MNCSEVPATALLPHFAELLAVPQRTLCVRVLRSGGLADSMDVLCAGTATGDRRLVALAAPVSAPEAATQAASRTTAAAAALGPSLGVRVQRPIATGWTDGRSYSIFPFLHELPSSPLRAMLVRAQLRGPVTRWLLAVAASTASRVPCSALPAAFERPLAAIAGADDLPRAARQEATAAIARLKHGAWQPTRCVMHGDLWRGNFMLPPSRENPQRHGAAEDFRVIDWAGARLDGYPVFDLARAAESLAFPPRVTAAALRDHCKVLQCEPRDVMGYVLAALGAIALAPGHFARRNLVDLVHRSHCVVGHALTHS